MIGAALSPHRPVMLEQVLDTLLLQPEGCYVDGTFGRGGHTAGMLQRLGSRGRVIAFDRDPDAVRSRPDLAADPRLEIVHGCFSEAAGALTERGLSGRIQGVLLDLGVSSPQIDDPARGFSFRADGPLDMRMDPTRGQSVAEWLNTAPESAISDCLWTYGEERKSRKIAARICLIRQDSALETTRQLAELVGGIVRGERRIDPATRTFQALRIFINDELEELRVGLSKLVDALAIAGRIAVISFHSLEDRIVKRFFRDLARGPHDTASAADAKQYRLVFRKSMVPDQDEIQHNPRARSARLRVLERVA
jgi:16S rRNA (cytosine1402-N4)-methyltransferase